MTLQQLEYVVALDNYRQFTLAAEKCWVSQPTLTMQVRKLEDEIGMQLFDRAKQPLVPTKNGVQFIDKARRVIREFNRIKEFISTEKEAVEGNFSLGVIPTAAPYLLPIFLPAFSSKYPNTILTVRELQTDEIILRLKQGTLDFGILASPLEESEIREIPLYYEPFLLYSQEKQKDDIKASAADLDISQMLVLTEGHCFRNQMLSICNSNAPSNCFNFNYESGSIEALKKMVKNGIGYTLVPELAVQDVADELYTTRFADPQPVREMSIVVHTSFAREALIEGIRKTILGIIPKHLQKDTTYRRIKWKINQLEA